MSLPIVTRRLWGARSPKQTQPVATPHTELWLHHTATHSFGAAAVRAAQDHHMDTKGWFDIGYNWLLDPITATLYEGRGFGIRGAHTEGHNSQQALCVLGNWQANDAPPNMVAVVAEAFRTLKELSAGAWDFDQFTGGHRDVAGTLCPGQNLYELLPTINDELTGGPPPMNGHDGTYGGNIEAHKANLPEWAAGTWPAYVEAGGTNDPASFARMVYRSDMSWFWNQFVAPLAAKVLELEAKVEELEQTPIPGPGLPDALNVQNVVLPAGAILELGP